MAYGSTSVRFCRVSSATRNSLGVSGTTKDPVAVAGPGEPHDNSRPAYESEKVRRPYSRRRRHNRGQRRGRRFRTGAGVGLQVEVGRAGSAFSSVGGWPGRVAATSPAVASRAGSIASSTWEVRRRHRFGLQRGSGTHGLASQPIVGVVRLQCGGFGVEDVGLIETAGFFRGSALLIEMRCICAIGCADIATTKASRDNLTRMLTLKPTWACKCLWVTFRIAAILVR